MEVCVLVTSGTLESDAIVILSSVNDDAVGKRRASANCVWCQLMASNFGLHLYDVNPSFFSSTRRL